MNTHFIHAFGELSLYRYPKAQQLPNLQAWDAVDEYLLHTLHEEVLTKHSEPNILIANDDFGALTCALHAYHPMHFSDSFVAQKGCEFNLLNNELDQAAVTFLDSMALPEHKIDILVLKIPKNLSYLAWQLSRLKPFLHADSVVLAGAKVPQMTQNVQKIFAQYIGENKTTLAKKKSRLLFANVNTALNAEPPAEQIWDVPNPPLTISNLPNVFSRLNLDIGGRFLTQNLPDIDNQHVIDLGCGNGVVGCAVLAQAPNAKVTFVDESYMAIASAKVNVAHNFPEQLSNCTFMVNDCLSQYDLPEADIVLCNPPFHQQQAITDHIAKQMFKDSHYALRFGGELRIIGNRHLPYGQVLKNRFGGFKVVATNKKFSILSAYK